MDSPHCVGVISAFSCYTYATGELLHCRSRSIYSHLDNFQLAFWGSKLWSWQVVIGFTLMGILCQILPLDFWRLLHYDPSQRLKKRQIPEAYRMHETPMNAACIKHGPTTGFRDFNIRFAYYIIFPESPKADGQIRALQSLKNETGRGLDWPCLNTFVQQ